jgi:hypothetical protein
METQTCNKIFEPITAGDGRFEFLNSEGSGRYCNNNEGKNKLFHKIKCGEGKKTKKKISPST